MTAPRVQLRGYQEDAIESVRETYRRRREALLVMCTGAGKTLTALTIAARVVEKGGRVLWLAHRGELVEQPVRAWDSLAQLRDTGTAGIVQGDRDDVGASLVCASTATVGRDPTAVGSRLRGILEADAPPVRLVVVDECHHYAADGVGMFAGLVDAIGVVSRDARPYLLGLTATPERMDGRDLSGIWGEAPAYVYGYTRAISEGYLVEPRVVLDRLKLDDDTRRLVGQARADLVDRETARALLDAGLVEWTAQAIQRHLEGRAVLAFCVNLEQAYRLRDLLRLCGFKVEAVAGETPTLERRRHLAAFEAGDLDVLVNCSVLTEGTDLPRCDAVVLARPFASKVLFIQTVGRGLRLYPGKTDCLVVDILGATEEHSLTHAAGLLQGVEPERVPFTGRAQRWLRLTGRDVAPAAEVRCIPREDVPHGDDRAWLAVSIEGAGPLPEPVPIHRPRDVATEAEGEIPLPDLMRRRVRVEAHWVPVPGAEGRAFVAGLGDSGRVWLVQVEDGWMSYHVPKRARTPRPLDRAPMDAQYARGLGDDLFRQAEALVGARARWRDKPASSKQREWAERAGLEVAGETAGDYADALTGHAAGKWWSSNGEKFVSVLEVTA